MTKINKLLTALAIASAMIFIGCANAFNIPEIDDNEVILNSAKESLEVSTTVSKDETLITLPKNIGDVSIKWTSNNEAINVESGAVTHSTEDVTVKLTAELSLTTKGSDGVSMTKTVTKTFDVLVYAKDVPVIDESEVILNAAKKSLQISTKIPKYEKEIVLPKSKGDIEITWESSNSSIIAPTTGAVLHTDDTVTVKLTAILSLKNTEKTTTKSFSVEVIGKNVPLADEDIYILAKSQLVLPTFDTQLLTQTIELPSIINVEDKVVNVIWEDLTHLPNIKLDSNNITIIRDLVDITANLKAILSIANSTTSITHEVSIVIPRITRYVDNSQNTEREILITPTNIDIMTNKSVNPYGKRYSYTLDTSKKSLMLKQIAFYGEGVWKTTEEEMHEMYNESLKESKILQTFASNKTYDGYLQFIKDRYDIDITNETNLKNRVSSDLYNFLEPKLTETDSNKQWEEFKKLDNKIKDAAVIPFCEDEIIEYLTYLGTSYTSIDEYVTFLENNYDKYVEIQNKDGYYDEFEVNYEIQGQTLQLLIAFDNTRPWFNQYGKANFEYPDGTISLSVSEYPEEGPKNGNFKYHSEYFSITIALDGKSFQETNVSSSKARKGTIIFDSTTTTLNVNYNGANYALKYKPRLLYFR